MRNRPSLLLVGLVLAACENGITVDVEVAVPVDVQQRYSADAPGRIVVAMEIPKSSVPNYSLGVVCEPRTEPIVTTMQHDDFGCAKAGTVRAWIADIPTDEVDSTMCGLETSTGFGDAPRGPDSPQAEATVFANETSEDGCASGQDAVELTLAIPE